MTTTDEMRRVFHITRLVLQSLVGQWYSSGWQQTCYASVLSPFSPGVDHSAFALFFPFHFLFFLFFSFYLLLKEDAEAPPV